MSKQKMVISHHDSENGTLKSYITGFAFSIILTITAYLLVVHRAFSADIIVAAIVGLALVQFLIQLVFFLHLGKETKPRWKLFVLVFMILIVLILVFGSIWIMNNLNYRMTPEQVNTYLNNQGGGF
jgi:cytochrome o ubiquinol oxidase operon protein cyoD